MESVLALSLVLLFWECGAYRILVVFPQEGAEHSTMAGAFVDGLTNRGHDVTFVTANPSNVKNLKHREIYIGENYWQHALDTTEDSSKDEHGVSSYPIWRSAMDVLWRADRATENILKHPLFRRMLEDQSEKFDLVVLEYDSNDALIGLGSIYDCPVAIFTADSQSPHVEHLHGGTGIPSVVPSSLLAMPREMNLWQRAINTAYYVVTTLVHRHATLPRQERLYIEHLSEACAARGRNLPSFEERARQIALFLSNAHEVLGHGASAPRANHVLDIAGFHAQAEADRRLSPELQSIMDDSSYGVIFVSLRVKSSTSAALKSHIAQILGNRKETILWDYSEEISGLPDNIITKRGIPQRGILAHPSVKLFIHCGDYLALLDSVHYAVPSIVMPTSHKQRVSAARVDHLQVAISLPFDRDGLTQFEHAVDETLGPIYSDNARKLSRAYHDRPIPPMDLAVFSMERSIRQHGFKHTKGAVSLAWYQYYLVDVVGVAALTVAATASAANLLCAYFSNKFAFYKIVLMKKMYWRYY